MPTNRRKNGNSVKYAAQYGCVKGRSTEVQLLHCTNLRVKAIDNKRFVDTVCIDIAKAFDTVSHAKLLHKLPKYGITGNILKWFASFVNGRKQRVKWETPILIMSHQESHMIHARVPCY